ncbi:MAG: thiamine pyrophosphate-dependent enzyme, partial [Solirubrobacterales bacterium]
THDAEDEGLLYFRSFACRAFASAGGDPRPGPVHLNVPWREPLAPSPDREAVSATTALALQGRKPGPLTSVSPTPRGAASSVLDRLAERIASSPRGLILAGRQTDPRLAGPLSALAAKSGYPILAEPTSQVRLGGHDRSRVVWAYDAIARAHPEALAPDLVIRVGDMPTSKPLRHWIGERGPEQIVLAAHGWNEPTRRAEEIIRADPAAVVAGLGSRIGSAGTNRDALHWTAGWLRAGELAAGAIAAGIEDFDGPSEPAVHARLGKLYADGDVVYVASSMPIRDHEAFVASAPAKVTFLCNRGANGIDGLVSSGAGAAVAGGRPTWIVTGDLGLVHDAAGLAAVAAAEAPVRVVVINNDGGGIFEFLPPAELVERGEFEALFGTPSGIEPARLAALYGLEHRLVEGIDELEGAAEAGSGLIEVRTARRGNVELHRRIADRVAVELRKGDFRE